METALPQPRFGLCWLKRFQPEVPDPETSSGFFLFVEVIQKFGS
jgi:hypothetical protein